ncbi:MAG: hypothetical protein PHS73_01750 [Candidatus Peribacteraceae bacterium]|nr:hypothetical protein [Candidatus Peribacteraceae bacterium]
MPKMPTTDEKLDTIIGILQRFEKREKLKMWGSLLRNLVALIPIIIFLAATWYTVTNADKLLQKITSMAAEQAARVTTQNASGLIDQFNNFIKK